jgi:SAM-dependent methyltransferase
VQWPYEIAERDHEIQNPTSAEKIRRLGAYLRLGPDSSVLDLACGKAGPALVLAREYSCRITGVELRPAFAAAARDRVAAAGLGDRIEIHVGDARDFSAPAGRYDAAVCVGATFVWGHIGDAAAAIAPMARQGGAIAIGEPFWATPPEPGAAEDFVDLPSTVDRFESAGVSLSGVIGSSVDEWDHYESQHWLAIGEWLLANPDHPDAPEIREQDRRLRNHYLLRRRGRLEWAIFAGRPHAGS